MTTIFVTGGCGFIGSHFIRYQLTTNPDVIVVNLDKLTYSGNRENLNDIENNLLGKRYFFIEGDICDEKQIRFIFRMFKPTYVINFAAETHVDRSIHIGSKEFIDTNVYGVYNILEGIKNNNVEKAVFVSTDEVYGQLQLGSDEKFKEDSQYHPNVPYSATKAGGDLLVYSYYNTWKLPTIVTHCSNNYGPYQYPEKLIPFFVTRAYNKQKLPLYGDGKNVRDWIYVLDHVRALSMVLFSGKIGEVYNIGADNELQNYDIAKIILDTFKLPVDEYIEYVTDRPGHDRRYAIDNTKIKSELGWEPIYKFDSMIHETIYWYGKNQDWIKRIQQKTGVINPHIDLWKKHSL